MRLTLIGLLAMMTVGWTTRSGPAPARAAGDGPEQGGSADVAALLGAARRAQERGAMREAETLLRSLIVPGGDDTRAAAMLAELYEREGLALPVDEEAVRDVLATLGPGYRVTDTRHFVIVSDCDPAWRARREALLERTYHEVFRFAAQLGVPAHPPASKLLCVMMRDHGAYQAFGRTGDGVRAHWVAGYYAGGSNRVVLYDDETGPAVLGAAGKLDALEAQAAEARAGARSAGGAAADALLAQAERIERFVRDERDRLRRHTEVRSEAKTIHEAAHLIAFNCGLQARSHRYPMWITEGLATAFETEDPRRSFGPDRPCPAREEQFDRVREAGGLEPLRAFVGRVEAGDDGEAADALYAQSYGLFRHVARFHRAELAALLADVAGEPPGEISAQRHAELFERRFGPVERFERRWLRLEGR